MAKKGDLLDIKFVMKNGIEVVLNEVKITVFDAFHKMEGKHFEKRFIWGFGEKDHLRGVSVEEISHWEVLDQYSIGDTNKHNIGSCRTCMSKSKKATPS